jgi:hypothetical protein
VCQILFVFPSIWVAENLQNYFFQFNIVLVCFNFASGKKVNSQQTFLGQNFAKKQNKKLSF